MPEVYTPGFRLYPRGFLGKVLPPRLVAKAKPYEVRVRTTTSVGIVTPQQNTADANPVVEVLYAQYIKRAAATMSFEFREKILIAALDAFGDKNFLSWFEAQLQSPAVGDVHLRFLDDTLRFIRTGRRTMSLETWSSFLQMNDAGERPTDLTDYANEYFVVRMGPRGDRSCCSLVNTIQEWLSQPGGVEDLLGTLHLLFGHL
jgi:hypothetical protein